MRVVAVVMVVLLVPLGGCADLLGSLQRPDFHVRATPLAQPPEWNRDGEFRVVVEERVPVAITARASDGRTVRGDGLGEARVDLPDGTWDIAYTIDGHAWLDHDGIRIDATPPTIAGLDLIGDARGGAYTIGSRATVTGAQQVRVVDLQTGRDVATALPALVEGLRDGIHAFRVSARDEAGNHSNATVQVRVGTATELPPGKYDFGVVARYTNEVKVWDLSKAGQYLDRATAAQRAPGHLGAGYGIEPDAAAVQAVVGNVVDDSMDTMQAAMALFAWFAENLEYDETRLESDHLLTPTQVLLDREDPSGRDCDDPELKAADCDGLVANGVGNRIRGGICRDLAATYVSLLRAAGVPARLVSGYVGGNVDGFHAWVEFYAGEMAGQGPWVPVDVSPIDGKPSELPEPQDRAAILMQAFGVSLPEYLPLREVPPNGETKGWSTAIGVRYQWPEDQPDPDIRFRKTVSEDFGTRGVLCFDPATNQRAARATDDACPYPYVFADFLLTTQRTIDYGIEVVRAGPGTEVTAEVAYPVGQEGVPFVFYGRGIDASTGSFSKDAASGKGVSVFEVAA